MSRLAFRSQLASIMEVLANAAVAEICRLVEEEHALCQRENRALRRKLHVLELRMARNPRVTVTSPPGPARPPPHDQAPLFDRQMDLSLWPSGPASRDPNTTLQDETPEVQLVEAEPLLVKEEKMEAGEEQVDGDMEEVPLIGEDGVVESHGVGLRGVHHQSQSSPRPPGPPGPSSSVLRGVEVLAIQKEEEPDDVVLVKVEEAEPEQTTPTLSIQEGLVESSTDDFRAVLPLDETTQTSTNQLGDLQGCGRGFPEGPDQSISLSVHQVSPEGDVSQRSADFSLFDLETFFSRWAPDRPPPGPQVPPAGPSCSYSTQDAVVMVTEPPLAGEVEGGRTATSQTGAGPVPVRLQAPPPQLPWSRAAAAMRQTQTQSLLHQQHGRYGNRQQQHQPPHNTLSGLTNRSSVSAGSVPQVKGQLGVASRLLAGERRRKSYVCRACGKAFTGLSNLEAHSRVHTGERPFRCSTCGKHFSEAGNLKKHQRVHTGEKPYGCQGCGKRFAWICNLRTHQQSASGCGPPVAPEGGVALEQ